MASTFAIPKTNLKPGTYTEGPSAVSDADSSIVISIDRTAAPSGLNSQPATATIDMTLFQSNDGGATWQELAENTIVGGTYSKGGVQINTDALTTGLNPGTGRKVQATVVVSGATITVQGTITTQ